MAQDAIRITPATTNVLYLNLKPKAPSNNAVMTEAIALKELSRAAVPGRMLNDLAMSTNATGCTTSMMAEAKTATSSAHIRIIFGEGLPTVGVTVVMFFSLSNQPVYISC